MIIDLSNAGDSTQFLKSEGRFNFNVKKIEATQNRNNGNRGIKVHAATDDGRIATFTLWVTQKALWKVNLFATCCGLSEDERRSLDTESLIGRRFSATSTLNDNGYADLDSFDLPFATQPAPVNAAPSATVPAPKPATLDKLPF